MGSSIGIKESLTWLALSATVLFCYLGDFALIRVFEKSALVDTDVHWVVGQVGYRQRVNK
jgi:hypothetical protein